MLLLDSWEDPHTWTYQCNLQFPQDTTPSRSNIWEQDGGNQEVVGGGKCPWIVWNGKKNVVEKINYNHHLSLISNLPNSSNLSPTQLHTNDPIAKPGCTGQYLDALTTIFHTREISENPINVKLTNSSKMASTHQAHIPLKKLSSQAKYAEIFPNLHSSLISLGQLFDDKCIVTFYKHKVIVSKNKYIIIEGYRYPTNGLWKFPLIIHPITINKWTFCSHTYATTVDQWRHSTPEHITQHPSKTWNFFTIRSSADQPNATWSRQSRMDPSKHGQDSQRR